MEGFFGVWTYRETSFTDVDLTGFKVQARDGGIGKIDKASNEADSSHIVVDTGPWIFGKKVVLPAGVIERVDREDEVVHVDRTKDQIKHAPEFDPDRGVDTDYRDRLGDYYGSHSLP